MVDRRRGLLLALGATALLSSDAVLVRAADADAFDVMFWTGLLSATVAFGVASATARSSPVALVRGSGATGLVGGLLQGITVVLFVLAVSETSVANVMVLIAAAPVVTALLSWLILRERADRRVWSAIALSACGIGLVISGSLGGGHLTGDACAVGATVAYALLTVWLRRHAELERGVVVGIGGIVMALVAVGPATLVGHPPRTWLALAVMGLVVGPLARAMIATAPRHIPATEVALFAPLETVLATLWAYLALHETPTPRAYLGGAIIVAALLSTLPRPTRCAPARRGAPEVGRAPGP